MEIGNRQCFSKGFLIATCGDGKAGAPTTGCFSSNNWPIVVANITNIFNLFLFSYDCVHCDILIITVFSEQELLLELKKKC